MSWAVLASGQSLSDADISIIKEARFDGRLAGVIAVSNVGLDKAPWADCLVSSDTKWWMAHPEAYEFKGDKYARHAGRGVMEFQPTPVAVNSGLMAMYLAKEKGAQRIILLGFDMHGTHYFGPHTVTWGNNRGESLTNTSEYRFKQHLAEFRQWIGPEVINCTPNSLLKRFPTADLHDILSSWKFASTR